MGNIPETTPGASIRKRAAFLRLVRKLAWFTIPFWALIVLYVYDDPFMVLHKYDVYDSNVMLNEHHVGWQIYKNHNDSVHFNSFILGTSCTMAFRCGEWEKYLAPGDRAIRLFGNAESMKAIILKLHALESESAEIKNVLLVLDRTSLSHSELLTGPSHILPAAVSGDSPFIVQMEFIQAFAMPDFLFPYLKYRITGRVEPGMKRMNPYGRIRDSKNNDAFNPREKMIEQEGEAYWENRKKEFPERVGTVTIAETAIFKSNGGYWRKSGKSCVVITLQYVSSSVRIITRKNCTRMTEKSCKAFSEKKMYMISVASMNLQKITTTIMNQDTIAPCWAISCWKGFIIRTIRVETVQRTKKS